MGNYQFRTKTAQAIFARLPDSLGENDWALKELSDRDGLAATYFHNRALLVLTAVQNSRSLPQGLQNFCRQQLSKSIDALKDYLQERASGSKDPAQLELRAEALAQSAFNLERVCRDVAQRDTAVECSGRTVGRSGTALKPLPWRSRQGRCKGSRRTPC